MKRYYVFAGDNYYPAGGWGDFQESFDTAVECKEFLLGCRFDWWEIVDSASGVLLESGGAFE